MSNKKRDMPPDLIEFLSKINVTVTNSTVKSMDDNTVVGWHLRPPSQIRYMKSITMVEEFIEERNMPFVVQPFLNSSITTFFLLKKQFSENVNHSNDG